MCKTLVCFGSGLTELSTAISLLLTHVSRPGSRPLLVNRRAGPPQVGWDLSSDFLALAFDPRPPDLLLLLARLASMAGLS